MYVKKIKKFYLISLKTLGCDIIIHCQERVKWRAVGYLVYWLIDGRQENYESKHP